MAVWMVETIPAGDLVQLRTPGLFGKLSGDRDLPSPVPIACTPGRCEPRMSVSLALRCHVC